MALPIEAGYLQDRLTRVRKYNARPHSITEGEISGKIVVLIHSGVGRTAARRATDVLIVGHRPRWIISAGFAGALDPSLNRNDLVRAHEIIDLNGNRFKADMAIPSPAKLARNDGRLLTVDRIVGASAEKAELRRIHQADWIDMETSAVADVAGKRQVRFISIRVISDDARSDLPREVSTLLNQTGSYRFGAAVRALWNRPSSIKDFWALHERALEAADRLADCLVKLIETLP